MTLLIGVSDTVHQKIKICLMCLKILYFNFLLNHYLTIYLLYMPIIQYI